MVTHKRDMHDRVGTSQQAAHGLKTAVDGLSLRIEAGRTLRISRPERRGQDHDDQDDLRLALSVRGPGCASAASTYKLKATTRQLQLRSRSALFYEKLTDAILQFIAQMYSPPDDLANRHMDEVRPVCLEEFVDDLTERYSHGMRQPPVFAAAATASAARAGVDEPTVGLGSKSVRLLKDLLRRRPRAA